MLKILAILLVVAGLASAALTASTLGLLIALATAVYLLAFVKSPESPHDKKKVLQFKFKDSIFSDNGLEIRYVIGEDTCSISATKKYLSSNLSSSAHKDDALNFQGVVSLVDKNLNPNISLRIVEELGKEEYVPNTYSGLDSNGKIITLSGGKGTFYHPPTGRYDVSLRFQFEDKFIHINYFTTKHLSQKLKSICDEIHSQACVQSSELQKIKEKQITLEKEQKHQAAEQAKQAAIVERNSYVTKTLLDEGFDKAQTFYLSTAKPDGHLSELLAVNKSGLGLFIDNSGDKWVGSLSKALATFEDNSLKVKLHDEEYRLSQLKERRFALLANQDKNLIMEWVDRINILAEQLQKN
jgi:hypothetical protein